MTESKLYKYAVLLLLVLNLGMIAFFILTKPPRPMSKGEPNQVVECLHLDNVQHEKFMQLAKEHHEAMLTVNEKQRELLKQLFTDIESENSNHPSEEILVELKNLEAQKILITYRHFEDIKARLNPDQKVFFPEFMHHAMHRIMNESRIAPPPQKDF